VAVPALQLLPATGRRSHYRRAVHGMASGCDPASGEPHCWRSAEREGADMSLFYRFRRWRLGRRIQLLADQIDRMQALARFAEEEEGRIESELIALWAEYAKWSKP